MWQSKLRPQEDDDDVLRLLFQTWQDESTREGGVTILYGWQDESTREGGLQYCTVDKTSPRGKGGYITVRLTRRVHEGRGVHYGMADKTSTPGKEGYITEIMFD